MSIERNGQAPAAEGYALARRGLPLPHSAASVSRAPWLPAVMRSRALPVHTSVSMLATAAQEETDDWIDADNEIPQSLSQPHNERRAAVVASADVTLLQRPSFAPELGVEQARTPDDVRASHAVAAPVQNSKPDAPTTPASISRSSIDAALPNAPATQWHPAHSGEVVTDSVEHGSIEHGSMRHASMGQGNAFTLHGDGALQVQPPSTGSGARLDPDHFNAPSPVRRYESESRVSNEIRLEKIRPERTQANAQPDQSLAPSRLAAATPSTAQQSLAPTSMALTGRQHDGQVQMQAMGLATASHDSAQRAPERERPAPAPQIGASELAALLAPAPTAPRTVRIDRLQVAVQVSTPAGPGSASSAPAQAPEQQMRTPAAPSFRSPWSSYFTRRD